RAKRLQLFDQPDRDRIAIELAFASLNGSVDDEDELQDVQDAEKDENNEHKTKHSGDQRVDQHRDLKIKRLLAMAVDFRGISALGQPDDERTKTMPGPWHKKSGEGAKIARHHRCAKETIDALDHRGRTFQLHLRAHAFEFCNVHVALRENIFRDDADAIVR